MQCVVLLLMVIIINIWINTRKHTPFVLAVSRSFLSLHHRNSLTIFLSNNECIFFFLQYGLAPKGSSVLLFRNRELRRHMYFATVEWPGGLYAFNSNLNARQTHALLTRVYTRTLQHNCLQLWTEPMYLAMYNIAACARNSTYLYTSKSLTQR